MDEKGKVAKMKMVNINMVSDFGDKFPFQFIITIIMIVMRWQQLGRILLFVFNTQRTHTRTQKGLSHLHFLINFILFFSKKHTHTNKISIKKFQTEEHKRKSIYFFPHDKSFLM